MISIGKNLTILESVDSTNNYAMAAARAGLAKHGDAFFAMEQVKGKGQREKGWVTEPGANIIMSVVLYPSTVQLQQQFLLSMAVALAAHDFFSCYGGDETKIKWPNDIYWRDRKAGGVLIENQISVVSSSGFLVPCLDFQPGTKNSGTENWKYAIAGTGININQTIFPGNLLNPVSLKQITGKEWNVIELAKELCGCLQKRYDQLLSNYDLLNDYNSCLYKQHETVGLKKGSRVFEAVIKSVNASGQLLVNTGIEEEFNFGEVEWVLG